MDTPTNKISTNLIAVTDSGMNINLARQAIHTMDPVFMENYMKARLPDGSTMDSTHIATLHISGISKQSRQIHIFPKMQTDLLILLGVLCDDGCTITLEKKCPSRRMEKK